MCQEVTLLGQNVNSYTADGVNFPGLLDRAAKRFPRLKFRFMTSNPWDFSDELVAEWDWTETQASQPEVLAYVEHFAERFDLLRDIQLETWVESADYDETTQRWAVATSKGNPGTALKFGRRKRVVC